MSENDKTYDPCATIIEGHVRIEDPDTGQVFVNRRENSSQRETGLTFVEGHVLIQDDETGEVLVDTHNAINAENMSRALAMSLANRNSGFIDSMVFGNGGSITNSAGSITYFPPNVTGQTAALYNQTYSKVVNDQSTLNVDPTNNNITISHISGTTYTDVIVKCLLSPGEPAGQDSFDDATSLTGLYLFDELGLRTFDAVSGNGMLITHCIFNRTQKSLNRTIRVTYTIRVLI